MKKKSFGLIILKKGRILMVIMLEMFSYSSKTAAQVPLWKTMTEIPAMPKADESGLAPVNDI